jgi:hypothetical protein
MPLRESQRSSRCGHPVEAKKLGLTAPEIDRMASAFEHDDLKAARAYV